MKKHQQSLLSWKNYLNSKHPSKPKARIEDTATMFVLWWFLVFGDEE